jgi:hypothetical protein
MTASDTKDKPLVVPTREPKKKTQGTFDNLRQLPQPHPVEELLGLSDIEQTRGSTPSTPGRGSTLSTPKRKISEGTASSISPQRDFTKVANSIIRQAVPSGIFGENGGKSKQLYDYLYSQTRGAVIPRRKVRIAKGKLMKGAGIGSEVTLRKNLVRLRAARLVKESIVPGTHGGNEYEVSLPEEVGLEGILLTPSTPSRGSTASNPLYLREGVEALEDRASTPTLTLDESTTYGQDKTLSKDLRTIDDDDAALAKLNAALKTAHKELTGKDLSHAEADRWGELADVLIAELKIAAARTTVSSVPSFLAEHLRRRLWKIDRKQARAEGRELPDEGIPSTASGEQAKDCSDCGGSGWWYPNGLERGVAKCKHSKLQKGKPTT